MVRTNVNEREIERERENRECNSNCRVETNITLI